MSITQTIYSHFPRKIGPRKAKAAIDAYMKRKAKETGWDPFKVRLHTCGKTIEFALRHARAGTEKKYIPHPATWYNRDGPDEDPNEWGPGDSPKTKSNKPTEAWARDNWHLLEDYGIPFPEEWDFQSLPNSMKAILLDKWNGPLHD